MNDGVYIDNEVTEYDVEHFHDAIPTYEQDRAEQVIKREERFLKRKLSESEKEAIRKSYKCIKE